MTLTLGGLTLTLGGGGFGGEQKLLFFVPELSIPLYFSQYMIIQHRLDIHHTNADAISRISGGGNCDCCQPGKEVEFAVYCTIYKLSLVNCNINGRDLRMK